MITKTKKAVKSANVEQEPVAAVKDVSLSPIIAERIEHFFKNHNTTTPSESSASYIKFANKSEYELVGCCGPVSYASDIPLVVGYKINRKHLTPFLNNVEVLKEYISILNKYLLTKENDFDIEFIGEDNRYFEVNITGRGSRRKLFLVQLIRAYQANYEFFYAVETFMKNICYVYEEKIPFFAYLYMCFYPSLVGNKLSNNTAFQKPTTNSKTGNSSVTYSPFNSIMVKNIVDYSFSANTFSFIKPENRYITMINNMSMIPVFEINFFTNKKYKNYTPLSNKKADSIFEITFTNSRIPMLFTTNTLFSNILYLIYFYILGRTINGDKFITRMNLLSKLVSFLLNRSSLNQFEWIEIYNKNNENKIDIRKNDVKMLLMQTNYLNIPTVNKSISHTQELDLLNYYIQNLFYNKNHNDFFNLITK